MPSSSTALVLSDSYRERMRLLRTHAQEIAAVGWRQVRPESLDESHARWAATTALRLTEFQRAAGRLSVAYLAGFVAVETKTAPRPAISASEIPGIGVSRTGKPLVEALSPTLITVKMAIGEGRPVNEALRLGLDQAMRNSAEDVAFAARTTLDHGIRSDDRVVGWRRVTGGGCGACLAAATGAIQADDVVLEVHDHCQCTKEPVVAGVRDTVLRPSGEAVFHSMTASEQDALFAGKGGAEKADLLRSGQVPFSALIARDHMVAMPDGITEAPLSALL